MLASVEYYWRLTKTKGISIIFQCSLGIFALFLIATQQAAAADEDSRSKQQAQGLDVEQPALETSKNTSKQAESDSVDTLPEVSVKDKKVIEDSGINRTLPITTITSDQLQRTQPSNIFDAVRSAPGVSINGGPRPSGMSFNIRGYEDNEDVLVKVDGVPKGFEKYRMGGTFIEPELLKSIEIQRGPQIASGSGSLGGTVIANTKDAEDFLRPGQKYGGKAKFGYGNNSDEYSRSYLLYARPDERVDILYNYSNRKANDITLGNGSKLANSAIQSVSHLLKFSLFPTEDLQLVTSVVKFEDSGLQQYDVNSSGPGFFGYVIRSVDDLTWSETLKYNPDHPWVNVKTIVGAGHSDVVDLIPPGFMGVGNRTPNPADPVGCSGIVYTPDPSLTTECAGDMTDTYNFKTRTVDISNEAIFAENGFFNASLLAGYQYNFSHRDVTRVWENPLIGNPGGFNATVPPGTKTFHAIYIQPKFEIGQVSIIPGYRQDKYKVEADGGTLALLNPSGQESKLEFKEETWSLGLAYDLFDRKNPEKLTFYSNYGQGFRPPLIDEYFAQGGFGGYCTPFFMQTQAPQSRICGDLYKPQLSESTEAGVSYQTPHLLGSDVFFSGKVNFFHIYTSRLLSSLGERNGQVVQNGWERRNGIEIESFLQYERLYARAGYSRIHGEIVTGHESSLISYPLISAPGNTFNLNIGAELTKNIDINLTYRKVSERDVIVGGAGTLANPYRFGIQDSYELWNVGARWKANEQVTFRLIGENLKNELYNLNGSFGGLGLPAPGRNVKFMVELTY